ncbi:MAG: hypothetical protein GX638_10030 [Crenarchaeota archaeon]|nr:hypothetical protein [Thermoproteota archaeon]
MEAQLTRNVTTEFVNGSILTTVTEINSVYNPAYGFNDGFPLVVSKTWTPYSTVTSTISTIINGETTQENYTSTATLNMVVDRIENLTTLAGTFETYVLVGTGSDGSKIETYYAPEVAMQIKEVDYSPTQEITFTMDLQSYQLTQPHTVLPVYWIIIAAAISSITICAIIVIILKHQNVKTNKTV